MNIKELSEEYVLALTAKNKEEIAFFTDAFIGI